MFCIEWAEWCVAVAAIRPLGHPNRYPVIKVKRYGSIGDSFIAKQELSQIDKLKC
jgi:hypothetical protein